MFSRPAVRSVRLSTSAIGSGTANGQRCPSHYLMPADSDLLERETPEQPATFLITEPASGPTWIGTAVPGLDPTRCAGQLPAHNHGPQHWIGYIRLVERVVAYEVLRDHNQLLWSILTRSGSLTVPVHSPAA